MPGPRGHWGWRRRGNASTVSCAVPPPKGQCLSEEKPPSSSQLATLLWKRATGLGGCCAQEGAGEEGPGGIPGMQEQGVGKIPALSPAGWIPAGRAVSGRRREGRGRAGRPEEGPPLPSSRDRGAWWAQLGLSPPATASPSRGSGFSPRAGSCAGASSPGRASSHCADEDGERELGAAGIRLAGTRLGESRPGTIARASVGGSGAPAPARTRLFPWPQWWFSWAGTSPRFWLSSRRRVSEREGGSGALSLHNPCPPGP